MGEAIGRAILDGPFPHKDISVLAAGAAWAYRLRSTSASATTSFTNTLIATAPLSAPRVIEIFWSSPRRSRGWKAGVVLNLGSAVMGPEVYLKALAMARNVAHQEQPRDPPFHDRRLRPLPLDGDTRQQAPKSDPRYYYRPWKTILVRTVADGGESFYVEGDHRVTIPHLRTAALAAESSLPPLPSGERGRG